jgi:hypothetical protein
MILLTVLKNLWIIKRSDGTLRKSEVNMKSLLFLVLIFSSLVSHAFIKDADVYAQQIMWDALMEQLSNEGDVAHTMVGEVRTFAKINDIEKGMSHRAIYLSAAGQRDINGKYIVHQATINSELWTLMADGKTWYIDQWFYYFSAKGEFQYSIHNIIEKEGVTIKKHEKGILGPIEQQEALSQELLSMWYF